MEKEKFTEKEEFTKNLKSLYKAQFGSRTMQQFLIDKIYSDHKKMILMAGDLGQALGDCAPAFRKEIYNRAIDTWGADAQIIMAIEECGELTQALAKFLNKRTAGSIENVCEEIADVSIMIEQLRILFDSDKINSHVISKTLRLSKRLDNNSFD